VARKELNLLRRRSRCCRRLGISAALPGRNKLIISSGRPEMRCSSSTWAMTASASPSVTRAARCPAAGVYRPRGGGASYFVAEITPDTV
jgi:hypothetical protein